MLKMMALMINSSDPAALAGFYRKVLGDPMMERDGYTAFDVGGSGLMIGPHDQVKGKNQEPARLIFNLETNDVQGEFNRIKGLGAEVVQEPYHPGPAEEMWLATLADPDGNYFQLATPMEM